jgi:hypothetical protein
MTEQLSFYDIVKKCKGGLSLVIPSFDLSAPERTVVIAHNIKKVRVPRAFALGIFSNPTLERMYKSGIFTVEPAKQFEAEVASIFFPIEDKVCAVPEEEILTMLKQGNRKGIRELVQGNEVNRDNVIILAREHIGDIPLSMIDDLNKILGVELQIENASME